MSKKSELKKQVIFHGSQINKLWGRVNKIEDKVMRKNYSITAACPNCFREQELSVIIGEKRPVTYSCEHCKCEVEPKVFGSW